MDLTIFSYEIVRYALVYSFILFFVWLIMVKKDGGDVSEVYLIIMTLFAARLYGVSMGIRARELRFMNTEKYYSFMSGVWWESRLVPEAIVFILLAVILTRRFVRSYFFHDPKYRKENGRRRTDKK